MSSNVINAVFLITVISTVASWTIERTQPCGVDALCAQPSPRQVFKNLLDAGKAFSGHLGQKMANCRRSAVHDVDPDAAARVYCGKEGENAINLYFTCLAEAGVSREEWLSGVEHACRQVARPWSPLPKATYGYQKSPTSSMPMSQVVPQRCQMAAVCRRPDRVQVLQRDSDTARAVGEPLDTIHKNCRFEATGARDDAQAVMRYCSSQYEALRRGKIYADCLENSRAPKDQIKTLRDNCQFL